MSVRVRLERPTGKHNVKRLEWSLGGRGKSLEGFLLKE